MMRKLILIAVAISVASPALAQRRIVKKPAVQQTVVLNDVANSFHPEGNGSIADGGAAGGGGGGGGGGGD